MPEQGMDKKRCFIITPIGNDNDSIRRHIDGIIDAAIKPALEPDYEVVAAHKITETGTITKQIIKEIYQNELAIANLTGNNPNVMYELAIRYCLGKPVLTIAEKGTSLPFDVMPERTIFYINDPKGSPIHDIIHEIDADAEVLSIVKSSPKGNLTQGSTDEILMHILKKLDQLEKITERTQIEVLDSEREYRYQCRVILESLDPDVVDEGKKVSLRDKLISAPLPLQMMRLRFLPNAIKIDFRGNDLLPGEIIQQWLSDAVETSGFGRVKNVMVQRV